MYITFGNDKQYYNLGCEVLVRNQNILLNKIKKVINGT